MSLENVTLYYFAIPGAKSTAGFGENLNLFLKDAGINFKYTKYTGDDYKESDTRKKLLEQKFHSATLPAVEVDGKFYNKTIPTMKLLGKKLDKYVARNDQDEYFLETTVDLVIDWHKSTYKYFKETDEEKLKEHFNTDTKKFLGVFNNIYGEHQEGPYLLGKEVTYPDFLVYHVIDEDRALDHLADYPNLQQFVNAFSQRPNLVQYFNSLKQ